MDGILGLVHRISQRLKEKIGAVSLHSIALHCTAWSRARALVLCIQPTLMLRLARRAFEKVAMVLGKLCPEAHLSGPTVRGPTVRGPIYLEPVATADLHRAIFLRAFCS